MAVNLFLNGSRGRMGQAIRDAVADDSAVQLRAAADLGDDTAALLGGCDVAIDFSFHEATAPLAQLCAGRQIPLVIGTTGHTPPEKESISAAGSAIPIIWAGNYSIGVNLLIHLVGEAAAKLPRRYQTEVFEAHHQFKQDAPSGTAENLIEAILAARGLSRDVLRHGREGITGERTPEEIGVHALRAADIVGEHTVWFAGAGERIELTHRATDRRIFAEGAIHAAKWLCEHPHSPGIYSMRDVLGLT